MLEFVAQITALLQRQELYSFFFAGFIIIIFWLRARTQPMRYLVKRKIRHLESCPLWRVHATSLQRIPNVMPVSIAVHRILLIFKVYDIVIVGSFRVCVVRMSIRLHLGHFDFLPTFLFGSVVYS